jgi:hypothetical protein
MLRDFGGRSISLSVRPRPVHQLAPEPPPEASSARRSSQYLKPMRYSSSALSGSAQVPPVLLHASSARPGSANLPRQSLTVHTPAWPAAARFPCAAFAPSRAIPAGRQVICHLPAPGLPACPTSCLKRPDPRQSKQGLLACPTLSLPARACAGTPLMIPAPHYPGQLPSSARSSWSSTVRSSSSAAALRRPHSHSIHD